eukprot:TRINITY_DN11985_c0_g1_i1.p1 TRINITY_DN11985_c0_g1~~TRINITY_DN11985_c0_g1_i1.p1  ORF type:complete len:294 (-),score=39.17 TRINITY_DN11985_c0_g1_i1:155-1036(-)
MSEQLRIILANERDNIIYNEIEKEIKDINGFHQNSYLAKIVVGFSSLFGSNPSPGESLFELLPVLRNNNAVSPLSGIRKLLSFIVKLLLEFLSKHPSASATGSDWIDDIGNRIFGILSSLKQSKIGNIIKEFAPLLTQINLALFFLYGTYYSLANRLLKIQYISMARNKSGAEAKSIFRLFGILVSVQTVLTVTTRIVRHGREISRSRRLEQQQHQTGISSPHSNYPLFKQPRSSRDCCLCLSKISAPAAAPCGHVFCWSCVSEWCIHHPHCPFCRSECKPREIVRLFNDPYC